MLRTESDPRGLFSSGETSDNDCGGEASGEEADAACACEAGPCTLYPEAHAPSTDTPPRCEHCGKNRVTATRYSEGYGTEEECAVSDPQGESDADADIEDTDCRFAATLSLSLSLFDLLPSTPRPSPDWFQTPGAGSSPANQLAETQAPARRAPRHHRERGRRRAELPDAPLDPPAEPRQGAQQDHPGGERLAGQAAGHPAARRRRAGGASPGVGTPGGPPLPPARPPPAAPAAAALPRRRHRRRVPSPDAGRRLSLQRGKNCPQGSAARMKSKNGAWQRTVRSLLIDVFTVGFVPENPDVECFGERWPLGLSF